jgi:hypothetical protein
LRQDKFLNLSGVGKKGVDLTPTLSKGEGVGLVKIENRVLIIDI